MYMLLTGQRRYPCDRKGHSSIRVEGEFLCVCLFSTGSLQSSFVFVFFSTGSLQRSYVFVLFQLGLYKVPDVQVKMSGEDLKACVLEIQEVLVNWTTWTELSVPGVGQQNSLCISLWSTLCTLEHFVRLLVEHLVWTLVHLVLAQTLSCRHNFL